MLLSEADKLEELLGKRDRLNKMISETVRVENEVSILNVERACQEVLADEALEAVGNVHCESVWIAFFCALHRACVPCLAT